MDKQTQQELTKIVKRNYSVIAQSFATTRQKQIWPTLMEYAKAVQDQESILDIGCGSGRLFNLFKDKKIKYLGIDSCPELLKIAKEKFAKEQNNSQPEFINGDILNLTAIPQINFDHIFCIAVLHHLPGKQLRVQALKQLKNKIKPDGQIIITVWNLWNQPKYKKMIIKFWLLKLLKKNKMDNGDILFDWKDPKIKEYSQRYYHAFTQKQLRELAELAGLKIKQLQKDPYNYYLILSK